MILNLGIGLITPPVGPTLFVGCAIGKVTMEQVSKELWPFYGAMCVALLLVTYVPAISLWLPSLRSRTRPGLRPDLMICRCGGRLRLAGVPSFGVVFSGSRGAVAEASEATGSCGELNAKP